MKLALVAAASALGACGAAGFDTGAVTVHRATASVDVRGVRGASETMRLAFDLAPLGLDVAWSDASGLAGSLHVDDTLPRASGRANAAGDALALTADGHATFNNLNFDLNSITERNALAAALGPTALGALFQRMLPFRTAARAHMAETGAAFDVAALALAASASGEVAWPADHVEPADLLPPGLLWGDTIGLGMTCSTQIECPDSAPFCTTVDHTQARGFCSRSCLRDADCATASGRGSCQLQVSDIPDVQGAVQLCAVECGAAAACPALLTCSAHLHDAVTPDLCFPPQ